MRRIGPSAPDGVDVAYPPPPVLRVRVEGLRGAKNRLNRLSTRQRTEIRKELAKIGKNAKRRIRRRTRVDTGALRRSMRWRAVGKLAVEWSYGVYYARFIEFGTRYFKGVTGRGDRVMERTLGEMFGGIVDALDRAVKRANRK